MSTSETLKKFMGNWSGANRLWLSPREAVRESETMARVAPAARGQFVTLQYTWVDDGHSQEGLILIGVVEPLKLARAVWVDSWHMGDKFMVCEGKVSDNGVISMTGSYAAPEGPDWGWRIEIDPGRADSFDLVMFNITPEGEEALAVQASYQRD
jgi:hypothetical protein